MRWIGVLISLPILMFALETVNLVKDHGFEKDSEVWNTYIITTRPDSKATVDKHDSVKASNGKFSGSGDTRTGPENPYEGERERPHITQGFCVPKTVSDIDSLTINYSVYPRLNDFQRTAAATILLLVDGNSTDYWELGYSLTQPGVNLMEADHLKYLKQTSFAEDTLWHTLKEDVGNDIDGLLIPDIPTDATLDSIILRIHGIFSMSWYGQKVFFDDVCLMGYADYDVGVKEITSVTETIPYTPTALIKNFGREPADFQVFAEILQGETQVYHDSIDWSLSSDTEDNVSFSEFIPPDTGAYLLRIYTVMDPDESDADDELTKELHFTAIAEPPVTHPQLLTLDVKPTTTTPLHVSYSLPNGHTGTLTLFDLSGRRVDAQRQVRGYGAASFNSDLTAGVYIVSLEASGTTLTRKVVVVE
ncbi:T9SS type A sorting domain-containing protein [candidate division WOR-3 bacterium]|nr:T9SS type A sorting domain-containing protein [candidate division WOR-3 bacterium]